MQSINAIKRSSKVTLDVKMADLTLFGTLGSEIDIHVTPFQQVKAVSFLNGHHARIKIFITITVLIIEIDIRVTPFQLPRRGISIMAAAEFQPLSLHHWGFQCIIITITNIIFVIIIITITILVIIANIITNLNITSSSTSLSSSTSYDIALELWNSQQKETTLFVKMVKNNLSESKSSTCQRLTDFTGGKNSSQFVIICQWTYLLTRLTVLWQIRWKRSQSNATNVT